MPLPRDPLKPEFYVYRLEASGVPFYVGIGRAGRASDRVRYVRNEMAKADAGKPVKKWSASIAVIAGLLRAGQEVHVAYLHEGLTRPESLRLERVEIDNLNAKGFPLANLQHNPRRPQQPQDVVDAVLARIVTTS